ncbi:MAG: c-type cytochrome, partial [Anaerolineales bacterium]
RREGQFDVFANFNFDLRAGSTAQAFPWNRVNGGLLIFSALTCLMAINTLARTQAQFLRLGATTGLALFLVGLLVFYRPADVAPTGPINPIAPSADSIAIGQALYQANCVACHGPTGKGDGPVGLTLNPPPADLSLHTVPGVHTDGQLYEWISNGFPGSVMPAFKSTLSEDERWHLVNYVRTLAPQ